MNAPDSLSVNKRVSADRLKIGSITISPPVVLAPMAGITSWPMRMLCREYGCPLAFTEMVPAAAIVRGRLGADTLNALKNHPEDRPLAIQLFGPDPVEMAEAARLLSYLEADVIDINMGCPVRKVVKNGAGAALMKDPGRAGEMVKKVRAAIKVPLTVKMRLGWDSDSMNAPELARICEAEGADAVTVHARTRARGFAGDPDLAGLREVVEAVNIPVIGNGGVMSGRDAKRMVEAAGCAGVMVARGARGAPWIFAEIADGGFSPPSMTQKAAVVLKHFSLMCEMMPERGAALEMRKHLAWYSKGTPRAAELRRELHSMDTPEKFYDLVKGHFTDLEKS
jgi:nifR3 family TIM-barrel protein